MKLNLLPTHTAKGPGSSVGPIILSTVLAISGLAGAFLMTQRSQSMIDGQKARIEAAKSDYELAVKVAQSADDVRAQAAGVVLNINLAEAMDKHNKVYTDLYDEVRTYIPSFFRVTSMSAAPTSAEACTVTLTGPIKSYQEYADLMLAMMRVPGAVGVGRAGFSDYFSKVPNLITEDQQGRSLKEWQQARRTDDPMQRMEADIAEASNPDFIGQGGFGNMDPSVTLRNNMPGTSMITVNLILNRDITTPDPRGTLASSASLWPAVAPVGGTTTTSTTPGGQAGPTGGSRPGAPQSTTGRPNTPPNGSPRPSAGEDR